MWINLSPSLASAPASADSMKACDSLCLALASSATLSGKHTAGRYWLRAMKRKEWLARLFGRMSRPSTGDRGVALTFSPPGSLASRSVSPASDADRTITATFGPISLELLAKRNPASCCWKMSPASSQPQLFSTEPTSAASLKRLTLPLVLRRMLERDGTVNLTETGYTGDFSANTESPACSMSSANWNRLVIALRRDCSARRKSARRTRESGYSSSRLWTSPLAHDTNPRGAGQRPSSKAGNACLARDATNWPTPNVPTRGPEQRASKDNRGSGGIDLQTTARNWPTARAEDAESCGNHPGATDSLTGAAKNWRTPNSRDWKGESAKSWQDRETADPTPTLCDQVALWQTPPAGGGGAVSRSKDRMSEKLIAGQASETTSHCSRQVQAASSNGAKSSSDVPASRPRLNPDFVSWLMGMPVGLTSFALSATALSRWSRRMRLSLCGLVCGSA